MKQSMISLLLAIILIMVTGLYWNTQNETLTAPISRHPIQFSNPHQDYGRVQSGPDQHATMTFTNQSDHPIKITSVRVSCGCLSASGEDQMIPPGGTGSISVTLNTKLFSGKIDKKIYIRTTEFEEKPIELTVTADIWHEIEIDPPSVYFGTVHEPTQTMSRTVSIINHMDHPVTITLPPSQNKHITGNLKTIKEGYLYELLITIAPPFVEGQHRFRMMLASSEPTYASIPVQVSYYLHPPVDIVPQKMVLPSKISQNTNRVVHFKNYDKEPLTITDIKINHDRIIPKCIWHIKGYVGKIILPLPQGMTIKEGEPLLLTFKTNHASRRLVTIPITQEPPSQKRIK